MDPAKSDWALYLPPQKPEIRPAPKTNSSRCGGESVPGSTGPRRLVRRGAGEGNCMSASDSNMGFRQRLLNQVDCSPVSDRRLSLLATGSADTVRNMRRGSSPRLDSLEALLPRPRLPARDGAYR